MPVLYAILTWLIIVGGGVFLWAGVVAPGLDLSADASFFASLIVGFIVGMIGTAVAAVVYDETGGY